MPEFCQFTISQRGSLLGNEEADFWGDSPIFELDRWNFQQTLDLGFPETSQSLSSFKQILFSSFHRGDQGKKSKTCESPQKSGSYILIGIPFSNVLFSSVIFSNNAFSAMAITKMNSGLMFSKLF